MSGFWFFYGCVIIGLLYYVSYDVFVGEMNEVAVEVNRTEFVSRKGNSSSSVSRSTIPQKLSSSSALSSSATVAAAAAADIFDFCPFEPPDPWHKSILKYMDDKYGFLKDCTPNATLEPITDLVNGTVVLKKGKEKFQCQARCIEYVGDNEYSLSNWSSINEIAFKCDFVETNCSLNNITNRYIHMQIVEQNNTIENKLDGQKNPDVLLLVIDSVASTQIIRGLPRTINFLMHGMKAVEFRKLNKVGSNSRPNAFPTLLGKTTEAVVRKPMNLPTIEADWSYNNYCKRYLDDEPFIPLEYKKAGYKTYGGEDYEASILNYPNCFGTKQRQFHHTYRPYHVRLRKDAELKHIHLQGSCRLHHSNMLDYLSLFVNAYKGAPKFSLTWLVDLAHDNTKHIYRADYELYNFFLKNRDALNNSFIFFFGDHGPRFGSEAGTGFGISEQKNPFLYVVAPKHLRDTKIHKQLMINSQEIVTHHDLHSTFKDILYNQPSSGFSNVTFKRFESNPRGSSLLRQFESGIKRTCKTLPIPFQYCICQFEREPVSDKTLLQALGRFAVGRLAATLDTHKVSSRCEKVSLGEVSAEKYVLPNQNSTAVESNLYDVTFTVVAPALGKFKIPIREEKGGHFELGGDQFNRLDKYGKHGDCMRTDILRPLCTCKK